MASRFPFEPFDPDREPDPVVEDPIHRLAYRSAVGGADAYRLTRAALRLDEGSLRVGNRFVPIRRYREIAFAAVGRAAVSQALAVVESLGNAIGQGFIVSPEPLPTEVPFRWLELPAEGPGNAAAESASAAIDELAGALGPSDLLILLLSGGALGYLARPPIGASLASWRSELDRLRAAGATGAELDLIARVSGTGPVGGGLAQSVKAEMATLIVDRGRGAERIGGGPTVPVTVLERSEGRAILERLGAWSRREESERRPFTADPTTTTQRPENVHRPVVVAEPADALRDGSGAVGDKHWIPRLADLHNHMPPEAAADRFLERTETLWNDFAAAPGIPDSKGLVVFGPMTLDLPEGTDEREAIGAFLRRAGTTVRRREMTIAAATTAGAAAGTAPPGGVIGTTRPGRAASARALRMRSGITDVGVLVTAVIPSPAR